ncbi:MAG: MotA/TolQ/ExbB proton channel family protein [Planctomycetota bacterium]
MITFFNQGAAFTQDPSLQEVVTVQTFGEFLAAGGPVMIPILVCSVVVVGLALERYMNLTRSRICPASLDEALDLMRSGHTQQALEVTERVGAPAGRILAAGIRRQGFAVRDVERGMEDQAQKEADKLRGNIRPLNLVAAIAPLMGLFGTVVGIAEAFHRVVRTGMGRPENLAAGIEMALTTTIAGLAVAIPTMVIAAHLQSRVRVLLLVTDEKLGPAVEMLAGREGESHAA